MMRQPFLFLAAIAAVGADDYNHKYKEGDKVDLWVNKVSCDKLMLLYESMVHVHRIS